MKAIEFSEVNVRFAENQEEYNTLPANMNQQGEVITCWELSEEEKAEVARTGKVWLSQLTFNQLLQPVRIEGFKKDVLPTETNNGNAAASAE